MVARTKPVTVTVAKRIQKSSGVRLMFFHDRRTSTKISAHHGFAKVHTVSAFVFACPTCSNFDSLLPFTVVAIALESFAVALATPALSTPHSTLSALATFDFTSHCRQYSTRC